VIPPLRRPRHDRTFEWKTADSCYAGPPRRATIAAMQGNGAKIFAWIVALATACQTWRLIQHFWTGPGGDWVGIGVGIIICFANLVGWQRRFPDR
jgi:hypothetical protein